MADSSFFKKVGSWFETNWKWIAIGASILAVLLLVVTIVLSVALSRSNKKVSGCERLLTSEQRQAMVISDPVLAKQGFRGAEEELKARQQQQQQKWPPQQQAQWQQPASSHYVKIGAPEVPPTPEFQPPYGQLALTPP